MSTETDNFTALRTLLTLKRHETPPPGYFDQFAGEVRSRLAGGEHRQTDLWREIGEEASWLQRLGATFVAKPAWAGAFGMAVCGLMLTGIYFSQKPDAGTGSSLAADSWKLATPTVSPLTSGQSAQTQMLAASSTNPVLAVPAGGSLFDRIGTVGATAPVNFQTK